MQQFVLQEFLRIICSQINASITANPEFPDRVRTGGADSGCFLLYLWEPLKECLHEADMK